ncbi:SIMPL domain-containing protein [Polymorphobacter arshaanensis]|uniref:SIMPL domain-containing protein n=1 Tax=Glacieibacterium arshaanense TaxID=2511025 RepID=A0A4Y9ENX7_9SPHN|nr:SIMPL domain-containing protein [Polymorphobacter arshaanensis]TFU03069.1 SIMPL domain-containing protein [Polymorphobacter arshaanensis]
MKTRHLAAIFAAAVASLPAQAQTVAAPTVTLSVEGRVSQAPDIVDISGGVVTSAPTAAAALADNATRMTAVVAAVRKAGIADRDIQTSGLSLQPQYKYGDNQPPVLTGYQANNTISIRVRKIDDAGKLIDTLVAQGANQISGPTFGIDKADAALDSARAQAVATGRTRADLYAKAAGLRVRRLVSISEGGAVEPGPRPMVMMARADKIGAAPPTPVAPGEVELSITVQMVYELE